MLGIAKLYYTHSIINTYNYRFEEKTISYIILTYEDNENYINGFFFVFVSVALEFIYNISKALCCPHKYGINKVGRYA